MAAVDDPFLIEAFGLDDPTILETTNFTPNVTAEQRDAWTQMWGAGPGQLIVTVGTTEGEE